MKIVNTSIFLVKPETANKKSNLILGVIYLEKYVSKSESREKMQIAVEFRILF